MSYSGTHPPLPASIDSPLLPLPIELEEQIVIAIGSDAQTLASCALVSRQWLHFSRKQFFATRSIDLEVGKNHSKLLNDLFELALTAREKTGISLLTFGPHIRDLSISGLPADTPGIHESSRLRYRAIPDYTIKNIVAQCPNLQKLTLKCISWDDISPVSVEHIHSLSQLTNIVFHEVVFTYEQLKSTLERLQPSITSCTLRIPKIPDMTIEQSNDPNCPLQIKNSVELAVMVNFPSIATSECAIADFLWSIPNLNVTKLFIWSLAKIGEHLRKEVQLINRYSATLVHLAIPLGQRYMMVPVDWRPEVVLSLQALRNLRSIHVGAIVPLGRPFTDHSLWLSELLRTLSMPHSSFSSLAFNVAPTKSGYGKELKVSYYLSSINWKEVENELLNGARFTRGIPLVEIRFIWGAIDNECEDIIKSSMGEMRALLGRVHSAGKLKLKWEWE